MKNSNEIKQAYQNAQMFGSMTSEIIIDAASICKNMMEVENLLYPIWCIYAQEYKKTAPCPPVGDEQQKWIDEVSQKYGSEILRDRVRLIKNIPSVLHNCLKYQNLCSKYLSN